MREIDITRQIQPTPKSKPIMDTYKSPISRTRVGRLMKQQGLKSKCKRKFKATPNSKHGCPVAPNLSEWKFLVAQPAVYGRLLPLIAKGP